MTAPALPPSNNNANPPRQKSISREWEVCHRIKLSRSTMRALVTKKLFPSPISLGGRSVGWLDSEIDDWIDARISASRNTTKKGT